MARALSIVEGIFGRACLLEKDRRVGPHAHVEPQIVLKISGDDFAYQVGDALAPCTRESVVLANSLELHANRHMPRRRTVILALYLSPQWLIEQHPSLLAAGKLFGLPSAPIVPRLRALGDTLAAEMMQSTSVKPARLQFLVAELVLCTFDNWGPRIDGAKRIGKLNDFRIRRAIAFMREGLADSFELSEVAARVGLSRSRFFELFSACTGLPPKHYLDMLRMEAAVQALARTQQPIGAIAHACGYSAQSHFTRFFVQQIGITPGEYRRASTEADCAA